MTGKEKCCAVSALTEKMPAVKLVYYDVVCSNTRSSGARGVAPLVREVVSGGRVGKIVR